MTGFENLQDPIVEREWVRNESVTVGTSSVVLSSATRRKMFMFRNTGTTTITINLGSQKAVAGAGIVLAPNNTYFESNDSGFNCYRGDITAISDGVGGTLAITER